MFQLKVPPKTGESGKEVQRVGYILRIALRIASARGFRVINVHR